MIVDEYNEKCDRAEDDALIQAHTIASLQRAKKLPELSGLLEQQRKQRKLRKQPQTDEQMFAIVRQLQAELGREEE